MNRAVLVVLAVVIAGGVVCEALLSPLMVGEWHGWDLAAVDIASGLLIAVPGLAVICGYGDRHDDDTDGDR